MIDEKKIDIIVHFYNPELSVFIKKAFLKELPGWTWNVELIPCKFGEEIYQLNVYRYPHDPDLELVARRIVQTRLDVLFRQFKEITIKIKKELTNERVEPPVHI